MIDRDLHKHAREFKGYVESHQYEVTPEGIAFPRARALARGVYSFDTNGAREGQASNILPIQSLNYFLDVGLGNAPAKTAFYLALFSAPATPAGAWTAQNFASTASEIVSASEGYIETQRRPWTSDAAANGARGNKAARTPFTIATAGTLTIRGAALLSDPTKGGTNGVLISAARFAADRVEANGNIFNLGYTVELLAA